MNHLSQKQLIALKSFNPNISDVVKGTTKDNPIIIESPLDFNNLRGTRYVQIKCISCGKVSVKRFTPERKQTFIRMMCTDCLHKDTYQTRFGSNGPLGNKESLKKKKQTCKERFGDEIPTRTDPIKIKTKSTVLQRYGAEYVSQTSSWKESCKNSRLSQTEPFKADIQQKRMDSLKKHYGNSNFFHQINYVYNHITFDSSWELYFYIYYKEILEKNIIREPLELIYVYNGKEHFYYPDFMVDGQLYEVKGDQFFKEDGTMCNPFDHSLDGLFEAKHQCGLRNNVIFLKDADMKPIIECVNNTYGENYINSFSTSLHSCKDTPIFIEHSSDLKYLKGKHYIKFNCEACNKETTVEFRKERIGMFERLLCKQCKTKNTNHKKYGVNYATQNEDTLSKMKETNIERYGVACTLQSEQVKDKIRKTNLERYGVENYTQSDGYLKKSKETCIKRYGVDNYTKTDEYKQKEKATNMFKFGVEWASQSPEIKEKVKNTFIEHYGNSNYCHNVKYEYDNLKFDSSWELYFYIYHKEIICDEIIREPLELKYTYENKEHSYYPDFSVNGKLYEVKGDQFFKEDGTMCNPFDHSTDGLFEAKHQCGLQNNVTFLRDTDMQPIIKAVEDKYSKDYVGLFDVDLPFPYLNPDLKDTTDFGLIRHFHKSIYDATITNRPSPREAWNDKNIVKKIAINRLKYMGHCRPSDILQGFNVTKTAGKVSVFKPNLAEELVKKYLGKYPTIFDPFSGFSGRLLGVVNCNKTYVGQDINVDHVRETNEIIQYKNLQNCSVKVQDILTDTPKEFNNTALFTCSPYGNKEKWSKNNDEVEKSCDEWIDVCLEKYKCDAYLFVVDVTEKYKDNIVEELSKSSLWGKSKEKVIYIERKNIGERND